VGIVVDKMALRQVSLRALRYSNYHSVIVPRTKVRVLPGDGTTGRSEGHSAMALMTNLIRSFNVASTKISLSHDVLIQPTVSEDT
jgi:hypothetical protein